MAAGRVRSQFNIIAYLKHSPSPDIARAIQRQQQDFDQTLRVKSIASEPGMSVSGFYHDFKASTAMSLLQFQGRL